MFRLLCVRHNSFLSADSNRICNLNRMSKQHFDTEHFGFVLSKRVFIISMGQRSACDDKKYVIIYNMENMFVFLYKK